MSQKFKKLIEQSTENLFKTKSPSSLNSKVLLSVAEPLFKNPKCFAVIMVYKNDKVFKHHIVDDDVIRQLDNYDPDCDTEDGYVQKILGMHLVRHSEQRNDTISIFSIDLLGTINSDIQTIQLTNAKSY